MITSDDYQVKVAFEKYGSKLRKQLVKTIESVEQYINQLGFEQDDKEGLIPATSNCLSLDEQEFFLDIIRKMRKLMTQMQVDMFQLICEEIETCLIEINNKFFIN